MAQTEIQILDKTFISALSAAEIDAAVDKVAQQLTRDYADKNPIFLMILNGSFMFASDLLKRATFPAEMASIKLSSYEGMLTSGKVREVIGLTEDITDRNVIIIEDIVDTGVTAKALREALAKHNPKSVKMATLLFKPKSLTTGQAPEFVGFEIPSKFILGYGLDLDGQARGLRDILVLKDK